MKHEYEQLEEIKPEELEELIEEVPIEIIIDWIAQLLEDEEFDVGKNPMEQKKGRLNDDN